MADPIYLTVVMPERVVGMTATVPVGGLSMAPATTEEMEAGTETALRSMSPALVKSAIEKLAPPPDPDFLLMNFPPEDEGMPFLETDWGENRNIRFVAKAIGSVGTIEVLGYPNPQHNVKVSIDSNNVQIIIKTNGFFTPIDLLVYLNDTNLFPEFAGMVSVSIPAGETGLELIGDGEDPIDFSPTALSGSSAGTMGFVGQEAYVNTDPYNTHPATDIHTCVSVSPIIWIKHAHVLAYTPANMASLGSAAFENAGAFDAAGAGVSAAAAALLAQPHVLRYQGDFRVAYRNSPYVKLLDLNREAVYPNGITITSWYLDCLNSGDPTTELDLNLKYCDAPTDAQTLASVDGAGTTMDILDTTTGNKSALGGAMDNPVVPPGKIMYLKFDADPTDALINWCLVINFRETQIS